MPGAPAGVFVPDAIAVLVWTIEPPPLSYASLPAWRNRYARMLCLHLLCSITLLSYLRQACDCGRRARVPHHTLSLDSALTHVWRHIGHSGGEVLAEILLALIAEGRDDRLQFGIGFLEPLRGDEVRSGAGPHEHPMVAGQPPHARDGLVATHSYDVVKQRSVPRDNPRDEPVRDALDGVPAGFPAQDRAGLVGLDTEQPHMGIDLTECLPNPNQRAAGPHTGDQRIRDHPWRQLRQDLGAQPGPVLLDVPLRLELHGTEVAGPGGKLARLRQRLSHVEVADHQHLRPIGAGDGDALTTQAARHDHEHPVPFGGGDHAQRVAGVAAARLDDGIARLEESLRFGPLNHVRRKTGLDRPGRIEEFALHPDTLDIDQRRVPDGVENTGPTGAAGHRRLRCSVYGG